MLFDDAGNAVWKGEISVFGDVVLGEWIGEELFDERVRFTGKDYDEVTGLYYFNARWYDPRLGRFTSEDPIRDGMNWHVYVNNNPLRYVDPTGLDPNYAGMDANYYYSGVDDPDDKKSSGDDGDSSRSPSKQLKKRKTGDGVWERFKKWWNEGWKQQRMEGDNFIPEGTYSPKEIDSLYLLYKLDHAIMIATRGGLIDQPTAKNYRNAIGDATILVLYGPSGGSSVAGNDWVVNDPAMAKSIMNDIARANVPQSIKDQIDINDIMNLKYGSKSWELLNKNIRVALNIDLPSYRDITSANPFQPGWSEMKFPLNWFQQDGGFFQERKFVNVNGREVVYKYHQNLNPMRPGSSGYYIYNDARYRGTYNFFGNTGSDNYVDYHTKFDVNPYRHYGE